MNGRRRNERETGKLYILKNEYDLSRVGSCWMEGRLKVGDVILCIAHTGDCFNDYVLVQPFYNGLKAILGSKFSAYTLGEELKWQPSNKEFHLLLSEDSILMESCTVEHLLSIELKGTE